MSLDLAFLLVLLAGMIYLFLTEKIPLDLTAFLGLAILIIGGYLTPTEAFSGLSSPAIVTMFATFIIAAAIRRTGLTDTFAYRLSTVTHGSERLTIIAVMVMAAGFSAFISNVAAVVLLLPTVVSLAGRTEIPPSKLLIPLSFGAVLGGTLTAIGTVPNIIAVEALQKAGFKTFGMLDFTLLGLCFVAVGAVYFALLGGRLLPRRESLSRSRDAQELIALYRLHERLFTLRVGEGAKVAGKSLSEIGFSTVLGAEVVAIERGGSVQLSPAPGSTLAVHDLLYVRGRLFEIEKLLRLQGVAVTSYRHLSAEERTLSCSLLRVKALPGSGTTLRALSFRERFGFMVAGVERGEVLLNQDIASTVLQEGDLLHVVKVENASLQVENIFTVVAEDLPLSDRLSECLFVLNPPQCSPLLGLSLVESGLGELAGIAVVGILRAGQLLIGPGKDEQIRDGDRLLVGGNVEQIQRLLDLSELCVESERASLSMEDPTIGVAEAVLSPRSGLIGKTIEQVRFRERYGVQVLALWREGRPLRARLAQELLRFGSALLLQGPRSRLRMLAEDGDFVLLSEIPRVAFRKRKAIFVGIAILLMLLISAADLQPLHVAAFIAATLVVLSGAVTTQEAYSEIEWRIMLMVAGIIPVGIAVQKTGAADELAAQVVSMAGGYGPLAVLAVFVILGSAFSQLLDSSVAVILLAPVAIEVAAVLQLAPQPFVMALTLAASIAFLTPFSQKAHLFVMAPGSYHAGDYLRSGLLLTVLLCVVVVLVVPVLFPY